MKAIEIARRRFGRANPLAPPDRRYQLARRYFRVGRTASIYDDRETALICRFLFAREEARYLEDRKFDAEHRDLITAFSLRRGRRQRWAKMIEAYLIAGATEEAIAERLNFSTATISWYRTAFFEIEHLRASPHRIVHDLIGLTDGEGHSSWEPHRIWKFIGYHLKVAALDDLLLGDGGAMASSPEGVTTWITQRLKSELGFKQLAAVSLMDIRNAKQREMLLKLLGGTGRKQTDPEERPLNKNEEFGRIILSEIPFATGEDAERIYAGTLLGEWDESAVDLRDDEVQLLAAGIEPPGLEEKRNLTIPPPRRKTAVGPLNQDELFGQRKS